MGDKFPPTATVKGRILRSIASPERKARKKAPGTPVEAPKPKKDTPTPAAGKRRRQTPAQRRASLANLQKAQAARG